MDKWSWNSRPIVVFAPAEDSPELVTQMGRLKARACDVRDREIVVIAVSGDTVSVDENAAGTDVAKDLRERFDVPMEMFRVFLVGKDGGVKLRSSEPVEPDDVFALIDGMPMRRHEMRQNPSVC